MRLLLDTHTAIWSVSDSGRLPAPILAMAADPANEVFVSVVSVWEIAIKFSLRGRDPMPFPASVALSYFIEADYPLLPVLPHHVLKLAALPSLHRDPFDRMLVSQALSEDLRLITSDAALAPYNDTIVVF